MGGPRPRAPKRPIINTNQPIHKISPHAKFQVRSYPRSAAIVFTTDARTDGHSSNILESPPEQMSPKNLGSQINISMRYKRIDKTNIPPL